MITALLTAAGTGSRMNQDIPKQFIHVKNKPLIVYTLEAFQNHPLIGLRGSQVKIEKSIYNLLGKCG